LVLLVIEVVVVLDQCVLLTLEVDEECFLLDQFIHSSVELIVESYLLFVVRKFIFQFLVLLQLEDQYRGGEEHLKHKECCFVLKFRDNSDWFRWV